MFSIDQLTSEATVCFALSLMAFCFSMLLTPVYTHFAFKYKLWKRSRKNSVTGEALQVIAKLRIHRQIPMMAGLVGVIAITLVTLMFNLDRAQTWLPLAALLGGGLVGLIDDIINVRGLGGGVAGLRAPIKFAMISLVGAVGAWFLYYKLGYNTVYVPFVGDVVLGWLLIPLFILVVVSTGNAVNITDGVDGLAGGLLVSSYSAFSFIALLQGNFGIAAFCATVVGALLAYVWFNIPPARFIMGDVGSFAFGTSLAVVAMLTDTLFLLPIIALVFVVEAGSTLLQILSKKILKRKILKAAPLHHHLEAGGWPKTKVTMRLWVIGQVCATFSIILASIGGYIG